MLREEHTVRVNGHSDCSLPGSVSVIRSEPLGDDEPGPFATLCGLLEAFSLDNQRKTLI